MQMPVKKEAGKTISEHGEHIIVRCQFFLFPVFFQQREKNVLGGIRRWNNEWILTKPEFSGIKLFTGQARRAGQTPFETQKTFCCGFNSLCSDRILRFFRRSFLLSMQSRSKREQKEYQY